MNILTVKMAAILKRSSEGVGRFRESGAVSYVTDVEGNYDYFQNFVRMSQIVKYEDEQETVLGFHQVSVCKRQLLEILF